jgi:class 3 adenylate cyclase
MTHPPTAVVAAERARVAFAERRWSEAIELLREADAGGALTAADLDAYGESAWWMGRLGEAIEVRERAFAAHKASGDPQRAAATALALANDYSHRLESPVASGWVRRAERLLKDLPESREHGYLQRPHIGAALARGAFDEALQRAEGLLEIGERLGDPDLEALGLQDKGRVLIAAGQVEEGMALLDEAVVAAMSGAVSPYPTAVVYCNATVACEDLTDYRRASEFADAAKRWCDRQTIAGFPGMCRVRRVEIIRLRGAWAEAEAEARQACAELQDFCLDYAGEGFYQIGEIRLRMGDLDGAEKAFSQAHEMGRDPQPGLALLRHAQGRTNAGTKLLARALGDPAALPLVRARLLPAEVELALALRDRGRAEAAAGELERIATQYGTHVLRAAAGTARGTVALADGEYDSAIESLRGAWRIWQEIDAPYEVARTRASLAEAYLAAGDSEAAELELSAAAAAFERLGAALDLEQVARLRAGLAEEPPHMSPSGRATRTFMFTDIVRSTHLIEAVGDEAWGRLLAWHDEKIRALLRDHAGQEVHHAGDGFFVAFPSADSAVDCALAIRRTLAEHRRQHGFAPSVRIGLHSGEALKTSTGYEGRGVHIAARIGALAGADEILASRATVEAFGRSTEHGPLRTERLRGIAEPVEVAALA